MLNEPSLDIAVMSPGGLPIIHQHNVFEGRCHQRYRSPLKKKLNEGHRPKVKRRLKPSEEVGVTKKPGSDEDIIEPGDSST